MAKQAIWVMLKAKAGKEAEVEAFLKQGASLSNSEPGTVTWYGVKMAPGMYGVFDTFNDEAGRDAHLNGQIAKALLAKAPELFANGNELRIERMEILASK
jgi:quinol monooxygenase YgiN